MGTVGTRPAGPAGACPGQVLLPGIAAVTTGDLRVTKEPGHGEGWPWAQPRAAAPLHEGLSTVMFYSPHTPQLKCKKRKKSQQSVVHSKNPKHDL